MAQMCEVCGKKPLSGHNVSHSNRRTNRRFNLNLQRKKLMFGTSQIKVRICTGCLRTLTNKMSQAAA